MMMVRIKDGWMEKGKAAAATTTMMMMMMMMMNE